MGVFALAGQLVIFFQSRDVFQGHPEYTGLVMGILSIPLFALFGAAFLFPWTSRTYSRTFDRRYPEVVKGVESLLREMGIPFHAGPPKPPRLMYIWRPDSVLVLERPPLVLQFLGNGGMEKYAGPLTRLYIGKFTKDTKAETRRIMARFDGIEPAEPPKS